MSEIGISAENAFEMNIVDKSDGQQHWRVAGVGLATGVQWAVQDGSNGYARPV